MTDSRIVRKKKIIANLAGKVSPVVIVGDSHVERMEQIFGETTIDGSPVLWAGIAGATFDDLATYIPWSDIRASGPRKLFFMCGTNNAVQKLFLDSSFNLSTAGAQNALNSISYGYSAVGGDRSKLVLVSDPPIERDFGVDPRATYAYARMMYYAATLDWSVFGWPSSPGPFRFTDEHYLRSIPGGTKSCAVGGYVTPCFAASPSTQDQVHMSHDAYAAIWDDMVLSFSR